MTSAQMEYDYIVVGAGSSGSVIAARLSENPSKKVLLIEAGGTDWEPLYRLPLMGGKMYSYRRNNWFYSSEPQQYSNNRRIFLPRGKMIGGTSNMNGIVYIRGNKYDFDLWHSLGNKGWSYSEVLPYFKRTEAYKGAPSPYHNLGGELPVAECVEPNVTSQMWVQAGIQAGYKKNGDPNGAEQDGFGLNHHNVWEGRRWTTARALLHVARRRSNLTIITNALVQKLNVHEGRATGIEWQRNGTNHNTIARHEVILAAGAINSPHLLLLSGIGDSEQMKAHGIPVKLHLPGVGQNLQDHYNVTIGQESLKPVTLAKDLRLDRMILNILQAWVLRRGPVSISPIEAGAFLHVDKVIEAPDIQVAFTSIFPDYAKIWFPWFTKPTLHSYGACLWPSRPFSRGSVSLRSADPKVAPIIDPCFLSDQRDLATTREGIRLVRKVLAQSAFQGIRGRELAPGADAQSDDQLNKFIRQTGGSGHHACGSVKMGNDKMAVVDDQLRVRGLQNLRVADASIMPTMVSGNTNATAIMIGEKVSDLVLGKSLPAENISNGAMGGSDGN